MQAARLQELRRRPRRGSLERPVNGRLVRISTLVLVLPLAVAAITVSRPGPLPVPALPPSFDGTAAISLATELARNYPNRLPGSTGDEDAARWFVKTLRQYGLNTRSETWRQRVPGLGTVQLRNLVVVVQGSAKGTIVFAAHRDTSGIGAGANDDATGTAALIQLARAYATVGTAKLRPKPLHTLVFVSTDAGARGGLGAHRFVTRSRLRRDLLAAVVLDGLGGAGSARIDIGGDRGRSPAPALVQTAAARVREQVGERLRLPGTLRQLVDLGLPFGYGDQAPFLGAHVSAVRLTTADDSGRSDVNDRPGRLDRTRFAHLGAAAQNLLVSLDSAGELAQGTAPIVDVRGRIVRGWAIALALIAALLPFLAGVIDLLVRARRHEAPLAPAFRALRRRIGFCVSLGALIWLGSAIGVLPSGPARPLPPSGPTATDWPVTGLVVMVGVGLTAWFVTRRRLVPTQPASHAEELAGYVAALVGLGALGVVVAIVHPFALTFLIPSLYAWLWLPQVSSRAWIRDVLFGAGLVGALLVVISVGDRLQLGGRTPLYLLQLVSAGYIPWTTLVLALAWTAIAAQLGALAVGRYGPYSGGLARPPRGPIREGVRRAVLAAQSRRR